MNNTYAINTTRGKEFWVEEAMRDLGLKPWVPRRLESTYVKEKKRFVWYDKPYIPKLMFGVIPAIYWPDVVKLKHVIGKPYSLSRRDVHGEPAAVVKGTGIKKPAVFGLVDFKRAVEEEYADAQRKKDDGEYECLYAPGQALRILEGPFEGLPAEFKKTIKRAHYDYTHLRLVVSIFGRATAVDVRPDMVRPDA